MSAISNIRAGISCLPVVGPLVALYNAFEVKIEATSFGDPLISGLTNMKVSCIGLKASLSAFSGNAEGVDESLKELEGERNKVRNEDISLGMKGRLYSICGITGNALTVATAIALFVFGVLSKVSTGILVAGCVFQICILSYNLYQHTRLLKACQNDTSQV